MIRREALTLLLAAPALRWPGRDASPRRIGALAAADWLGRPDFMMYDVGDVHALHYAEVCCAHGALLLALTTRDVPLRGRIAYRLHAVMAANLPNTRNHVDANVFGVWPIELGFDESWIFGLELADGQWAETTPDGLTKQARYWIDDIWMIGMLQIAAWWRTHEPQYLDRAALMARLYLAKLQQPGGLFHHGPEAPFFWGRGNGWVAAGLAEILSVLPENHPGRAPILAGYRRMMAALLDCLGPSGLWNQLVDRPAAWPETSGSAMFTFAFMRGVNQGLLPASPYRSAALAAWSALRHEVEPDGRLRGVCVGTGQAADAQYYLDRPVVTGDLHGQAALLWAAAELIGTPS